tara:strand:- start:172 stop:834 length:663 start_codon:yes stop_codon:yes gene_type:complete
MRIALFLIFLIVMAPMAVSAHGADKFSVIVRGTYMQPDTVDMVQNDTVEFISVNNSNRSVRMDFNSDGDYNDTFDFNCVLPSGGMCALEMNVTNYTGDLYIFEILEENGTLAFTLNLTLINDTHNPNSSVPSPTGYSFGNNQDVDQDGIPDDVDRCVNTELGVEVLPLGEDFQGCDANARSTYLILLSGLLIVLSAMMIVSIRRNQHDESEKLRKEDYNA